MAGETARLGKRFSLVSLVAAATLAFVPSGTGAATTIGSNLANSPNANGLCGEPCTLLGLTSPPNPTASPIDGVVVSWSTFSGSGTIGTYGNVRVRILRPAGGGAFTAVRSGPPTSIPSTPSSTRITTPLSPGLPIAAGDYVAINLLDDTSALAQRTAEGEGFSHAVWFAPDLADGTTRTPSNTFSLREMLYQATVEPIGVCKGQQATISGTAGNESINGTSGRDVIAALGGKDKVSGLAGKDLICGGAGKDTLNGGPGKDTLLGQGGKDKLKGGGAKDICKGGKGNDSGSCEVEKSV
jgi:hypothetical protein